MCVIVAGYQCVTVDGRARVCVCIVSLWQGVFPLSDFRPQ